MTPREVHLHPRDPGDLDEPGRAGLAGYVQVHALTNNFFTG